MREGLHFLWIFSLNVSLWAWLYYRIVCLRKKKTLNRSQVMGYEIARQVLDRNQLARTAVYAVAPGEKNAGDGSDALGLDSKIYSGTTLTALASALKETIRFLEGSKFSFLSRLGPGSGRPFRILVGTAWFLIVTGFLFSSYPGILDAGKILYIFCFFLSLGYFPLEWEISEKGAAQLSTLERLWTDERVAIKKILKASRGSSFAELIDIPLRVVAKPRSLLLNELPKR